MTTLNDSQDDNTISSVADDEVMDDASTTPSVMLSRKGLFGNSAACLSDNYENPTNENEMEVDEPVNEENEDSNCSIPIEEEQDLSVPNEPTITVEKIEEQENHVPTNKEESHNDEVEAVCNESANGEAAENTTETEPTSSENNDVSVHDAENVVEDETAEQAQISIENVDDSVQNNDEESPSPTVDNPVLENNSDVDSKSENADEIEIESVVEEESVKQIVSMDTVGEEQTEKGEISFEEEVEKQEENISKTPAEEEDEEEDETPRKRAKRNAPKESNEDEDIDNGVDKKNESTVDENEGSSNDIEAELVEESEDIQEDVLETPKSTRSTRSKVTPKTEPSSTRSTRGKQSLEGKDEEQSTRTPRATRSAAVEQSSERSEKVSQEHLEEEDNTEQDEEESETIEESEEPEVENPKSTTRSSRRSTAAKSVTNTPASTRSRRSAAAAVVPTPEPKSAGKRKSRATETEQTFTPKRTKEDEIPVETPSSTRSRRERKVVEKTENVVATPKSAVKTSTKSRSAKKVSINEPEDENEPMIQEEEEEEKRDEVVVEKVTKKTPKSTKSTPAYKKKLAEPSDEFDPYDMDTEMEKHPEPLKNIHMEVQNFGAVKYAKVGNSASKYESTERAAESRISSLSNTPSQRKERKSLAEMTPGKEKIQHRVSIGSAKSRSKAKKVVEEFEDDDEMIQNDDTSSKAKTGKGRKRKSDDEISPVVSAKKVAIELPSLSAEEQWKVDHPEDEHEPHAPGARVYALFGKVYYPAVVASERDGLGRFKVEYTADKIVKDVPSAGIIPLRAVVAGKQCFYKEDVLNVIACPNAASAGEWTEGVFELEDLDEKGDPTGDTIRSDWSDISLDMLDWKDYINKKSSEATAIVADNITTPSQIYRAARRHVPAPVVKMKDATKKTPKTNSQSVEGQNNSPTSIKLVMNENGIGKDVFQGRLFILTSSTRQNAKLVPLCMRKNELREFVEENGGRVTEHFQDVDDNSNLEAFLVSDRYYRTHKYLAALARGVPCVSQNWIKECANMGHIVDYNQFVLKAGVSALDDKEYPLIKDHSSTLAGLKFFVHTTQEVRERTQTGPGSTFIQIWHPLIELLGGEYVDCDPSDFEKHDFNAVITDGNVDEKVEEIANEKGIRILTSEFIIEAIITGKAPDLDETNISLDHLRKTKQDERPKKSKGRSH